MKYSEKNPWQSKQQSVAYSNPWIEVTHHAVITPGNTPGIYGVVHFEHKAVGLIPIDEHGYTWLIGQTRFPLNSFEWEIPEGGCAKHEDPLSAAKRELLEETGLSVDTTIEVANLQLSNAATDEIATIYAGFGVTKNNPIPQETEQLTVERVSFVKALELVDQHLIRDAMSVAGILQLYRMYTSGKLLPAQARPLSLVL